MMRYFCLFENKEIIMIVLASASPRRKEILSALGVDFKVITADTDESSSETDPRALTEELATRKGKAVYELMLSSDPQEAKDAIIISADTVVFAGGRILGKPRDAEDALDMLRTISGDCHSVVSGIAVTVNGVTKSASDITRVRVDAVPENKLREYVDSGEPMDKAGAYAIQGHFSPWIGAIEGCYWNVVGLPVNRLNKLIFECTGKYLI
jgi:septum formation protein